jgi:hypothetical protein
MAATNLLELRSDPRFISVTSPQERATIVEQIAKTDTRFQGLPEEEQIKVLNELVTPKLNFEEIRNRPEPYAVNPQAVALGTAVGGIIGGPVTKLLTKGATLLVPTLEGSIAGGASTLAGEVVKAGTDNSNVGQMVAFGAELATGASLPLARDLITRIPTSGLMAVGGYAKAKIAQTVMGTSKSNQLARERIFGKDNIKAGTATDKFKLKNDTEAAQDITQNLGIQVAEGQRPQDALRNGIYEQLSNENLAGNTIRKSPEYLELMTNLNQGIKDGVVKKEDVTKIKSLLDSQTSPYNPTQKSFNERLINTIQQADPKFNGEPITEAAAGMMRESLDKYLSNISGKPLYSALKQIEMNDKIAIARDSIPVLIQQGFKGDAIEQALVNLSKSPLGMKDFQVALASYMKTLPEKEALSEFNRLYPVIIKSKVMPLTDAIKFKRQVTKFVNKGYLEKAGDITGYALKMGIITGIVPAEVSSRVLQDENTALEPFNM